MTKIEEVARALHARKYGEWYEGLATLTDSQRECLANARAAIEAMRKPTKEMVEAARSHHEGEPYLPHSVFNSMIDAVLSEGDAK